MKACIVRLLCKITGKSGTDISDIIVSRALYKSQQISLFICAPVHTKEPHNSSRPVLIYHTNWQLSHIVQDRLVCHLPQTYVRNQPKMVININIWTHCIEHDRSDVRSLRVPLIIRHQIVEHSEQYAMMYSRLCQPDIVEYCVQGFLIQNFLLSYLFDRLDIRNNADKCPDLDS